MIHLNQEIRLFFSILKIKRSLKIMKLSLYFKRFGKVLGFITGFIGAIPFIGNFFANNLLYIAPPIKIQFLLIYFMLFIAAIYGVYFFKDFEIWKKKWGTPLVITSLFIISFLAFLMFYYWSQVAVRSIFLPDQKKTIYVIVGTERSQFAKLEFSDQNPDEDLLYEIGYIDADIRRLWTQDSINRSRLFVAGSYFLMLLCLTAIFSVGVLKMCISEQNPS